MVIDPLTATCPRCHAEIGQPCVRLSGPYGEGNPLRKMHKQRFEAVRERLAAERAREIRAAHASGSPPVES